MAPVLLAVLLLFATQPETPRDVDTWKREIIELLEAGRFAEATEQLEALYAAGPSWEVLFNWSVAAFRAGDCDSATSRSRQLLREYAQEADPGALRDAQLNLNECERLAAEAAPDPEPPVDPDPEIEPIAPATVEPIVPATVEPPDDEAPPRPWARDPLGGALVGVGGAFTLAGVGLTVAAFTTDRRADNIRDHRRFDQSLGRAVALERASWAMYAVGGALVVGGIVRYAVLARRSRAAAARRPGRGLAFRF